jgi:predicted nucleotide-binding protein (sugar kinase/HSP70/actin superfamily)
MQTLSNPHLREPESTIGRIALKNKIVLIPEMNRNGAHLLAAGLRGFGFDARVLETCRGLELGKKYTSGKECYPCQVTLGDILHFVKREQHRLGNRFSPEDYLYFMPESNGPCRFGMYNKFQRIVMDGIPGLNRLKITTLTTQDGYAFDGLLEAQRIPALKKTLFLATLAGDILDRLLWRIRPYEKTPGAADAFIDAALEQMAAMIENGGPVFDGDRVLRNLEEIARQGVGLIDARIGRKPAVALIGEIFLRMHTAANQNLIRLLEKHGAEVVCASFTEWVNFVSYMGLRKRKRQLRIHLRHPRLKSLCRILGEALDFGGSLAFQQLWQKRAYARVQPHTDIADDHKISDLEQTLAAEGLFCFDVDTEAPLSVAGILESVAAGCNGVVNVYPFTCMPGIITSAVVKPLMARRRIPYLDTPYDDSVQPGRETAVRTFMYQVRQHHRRQAA